MDLKISLRKQNIKPGENCEDYIEDLTNMNLLAGMNSDELSQSLIRRLPDNLKWQIVDFNHKTMEDTVERYS